MYNSYNCKPFELRPLWILRCVVSTNPGSHELWQIHLRYCHDPHLSPLPPPHTHAITRASPPTTCSAVPVARINYPASHLVENVISGMNTIATRLHQGWRNIQTVHLKSVDSIALPLFNSLPPAPTLLPGVRDGPVRKKIKLEEEVEEDGETSTLPPRTESLKREPRKVKRVKTPVLKKAKVTKVSAKKIKGSTVLSSRYEKALKKGHRKAIRSA